VYSVHGTSTDPCSDIYGGPKPFSEPETKALSDFILAHNATWKVYLTLHSYSQMWMAPYGYTRKKPDNYKSLVSAWTSLTKLHCVTWKKQWRRQTRWVGCVHTPCQENTYFCVYLISELFRSVRKTCSYSIVKNGKHTLWSIWFSRKLVKLVPPDVRF